MNNMRKLLKNQSSGFTLIEILVVIGIIAILAAIVIIAINPARQFRQARDSQRVSNVNAILNAIGQYVADNKGELPTMPSGGGEIDDDLCADLVPKYLPALPTDPSSDSEGEAIQDCSTVGVDDIGYEVDVDSNGRVTVHAEGEEPAGHDIDVTR